MKLAGRPLATQRDTPSTACRLPFENTRRNEYSLCVAGALGGGKLVRAVGGSYRYGERIDAGAGDEFLDFLGSGVGGILGRDLNVVLDTRQLAEFAFDDDSVSVSVIDDLFRQGDVVLEAPFRAVDHDR